MQKEQLQGSNVMPERHVWLQRYRLQESCCTHLTNNLDYSASAMTKQDLEQPEPELSRFYCTLYYSQWYMEVHFPFFFVINLTPSKNSLTHKRHNESN